MTSSKATACRDQFATYHSFQPGFEDIPGFHQYNLIRAIPGHPVGSTVSEATLDRAVAQIASNATELGKVEEFRALREVLE